MLIDLYILCHCNSVICDHGLNIVGFRIVVSFSVSLDFQDSAETSDAVDR